MVKINDNEKAVLRALWVAADRQGQDFGFTDEAKKPEGMSDEAFGGYVSVLQSKGLIECYTGDPEWENGFNMTSAGARALGEDDAPLLSEGR